MKQSVIALAAAAAITSASSATVIYSTDFNGPGYTNGNLVTQNGWILTGSVNTNPIQVANTGTNGNVALGTNGQDSRHAFAATTTDSIYMTATITINSAFAAGDYFMHMSDSTGSNFSARIYARSSGAGYQLALVTTLGTPTYGSTVLSFGTAYTVLARYDFVTGGTTNDTGPLFVNPANPQGLGDTMYVAATTAGTDATSLAAVCLRQGNVASSPTAVIDNISIFVPTPGSATLLGCGLLASARRRRA